MSQKMSLDLDRVRSRYPLELVDSRFADRLLDELRWRRFAPGETIARHKSGAVVEYQYLYGGRIEIRHSFSDRAELDSDDERAKKPLAELIVGGGTIKALEDCEIISIGRDKLDQLMSLGQAEEKPLPLSAPALGGIMVEELQVGERAQADWTEVLLHSEFSRNISIAGMYAMFSVLSDRAVAAGETIIEQGSEGDCFYIVKQGLARVKTPADGPFAGREFDLPPGSFFGDEALVADTIRNASVTMVEAGVLGCLSREDFVAKIKAAMVPVLDDRELAALARESLIWLDVRHPLEYRAAHREGSTNLPISHLRAKLEQLDRDKMYVVDSCAGRRGELAVYLLRQAGFAGYLYPALD